MSKTVNIIIGGRDFTVSAKSAGTLIKHLETSPPDSAPDYLRVVLETAIAADHRSPVELLDNEERSLVEALRELQRRRRLPRDLTRLLHGRAAR